MGFKWDECRVPDVVQRHPGDAKHRPVTLLRVSRIHI
jgi:hypothetical protein